MGVRVSMVFFGLLLISLLGCAHRWSAEDRAPRVSTPRVSKEELLAMMERPEVVIIDARKASAWRTGTLTIKGAVVENSNADPRTWAAKYSRDSVLVFYCD